MPRSAPPRRRLTRLVTAAITILATATLPTIFLPDSASADDVFNCYGTPFSEATYLDRYADVRAAVEAGSFPNGCAHFAAHGHAEGRSGTPDGWQPPSGQPTSSPSETPSESPNPQPTQTNPGEQPSETPSQEPTTQPPSPVFDCGGSPFSESVYLGRYRDVYDAIMAGAFSSGCQHFIAHGRAEGRSGTPDGYRPPDGPPPTVQPEPNDGKPRAAVALGDSFISGEGAGDYDPVRNFDGNDSGWPGWGTSNDNAYFCHRSSRASLHTAALDNIDVRVNLACSGGRPADVSYDSRRRERGRNVESQLDQLTRVAHRNDIDVVLIGLGSNNSYFTFGGEVIGCLQGFALDGFLMDRFNWLAREKDPEVRTGACAAGDFPSNGDVAAAETETYDALRSILNTLRRIDSDGQHRIVLQDYTNPLPREFHPEYHRESSVGRFDLGFDDADHDESKIKFRGLVSERYEAGCPIHRRSLAPGHAFSERLGGMVERNANRLRSEFPDQRIVYLNVQRAFDGARLCESNDPGSALATPARLMSHPDGNFRTTFNWLNKGHLEEMGETCIARYQTCQETWHPNAAGHRVLGQCLAFAARTGDTAVRCSRDPGTGQISG